MLTRLPGNFYYVVTCARTGCGERLPVRHVDLTTFQPPDEPDTRYDLTCPKCGVRAIYLGSDAVLVQEERPVGGR